MRVAEILREERATVNSFRAHLGPVGWPRAIFHGGEKDCFLLVARAAFAMRGGAVNGVPAGAFVAAFPEKGFAVSRSHWV
jgi:hypothetical protein